jgi:hypothetical protein
MPWTKTGTLRSPGTQRTLLTEGIVVDGSVDQADALEATFATLVAAKQPLWISPNPTGGRTVIGLSRPITIPSHMQILGDRAAIWHYDSGSPIAFEALPDFVGSSLFIIPDGAVGITLRGFGIHGRDVGTGVHGISATGSVVNVEIDRVTIRDTSGRGLSIVPSGTAHAKGWRINRLMLESTTGIGGYIDGLTDSDIIFSHAHSNEIGSWYFAGIGDSRFVGLRSTWSKGYGFRFGDSALASRPWGAGVQFDDIGTDRSEGPGLWHNAHNLNPITIGTATFGRDHRNAGVVAPEGAAIVVDGSIQTATATGKAGPLVFGTLTTTVGYDDTGQADAVSTPSYALSVKEAKPVSINGGYLWGRTGQVLSGTGVDEVRLAPAVQRATGTRTSPVHHGGVGVQERLRTTSTSTQGINTAGDRTFTVAAGLDWAPGMTVRAASTAGPSVNYIEGPVKSYVGTTLVIDGTLASRVGSGSLSSWIIDRPVVDPIFSGTPVGLTKQHIGLGNVSDISPATLALQYGIYPRIKATALNTWPATLIVPAGYNGPVTFDSTDFPGTTTGPDALARVGDFWESLEVDEP